MDNDRVCSVCDRPAVYYVRWYVRWSTLLAEHSGLLCQFCRDGLKPDQIISEDTAEEATMGCQDAGICPNEVANALAGISVQCAKGQYWNAICRVTSDLMPELQRRFNDVLKGRA